MKFFWVFLKDFDYFSGKYFSRITWKCMLSSYFRNIQDNFLSLWNIYLLMLIVSTNISTPSTSRVLVTSLVHHLICCFVPKSAKYNILIKKYWIHQRWFLKCFEFLSKGFAIHYLYDVFMTNLSHGVTNVILNKAGQSY